MTPPLSDYLPGILGGKKRKRPRLAESAEQFLRNQELQKAQVEAVDVWPNTPREVLQAKVDERLAEVERNMPLALPQQLETEAVAHQTKTCRCCNETKPVNEFYFQNKKTGTLQSYCIPCAKQKAVESAARKKGKVLIWDRDQGDAPEAFNGYQIDSLESLNELLKERIQLQDAPPELREFVRNIPSQAEEQQHTKEAYRIFREGYRSTEEAQFCFDILGLIAPQAPAPLLVPTTDVRFLIPEEEYPASQQLRDNLDDLRIYLERAQALIVTIQQQLS